VGNRWCYRQEDCPDDIDQVIEREIIAQSGEEYLLSGWNYAGRKPESSCTMESVTFYSTNDHDSAECIPSEYREMVKRAHALTQQLGAHDTKQALVLQTADHQLYEEIMDYKSPHAEDEIQTFLEGIGKDKLVVRLICCWPDGSFDLPWYVFRERLCDLNPCNQNAEMLLMGEKTFIVKPICVTMPPKKDRIKT
jgi:hypothetical protein